MALLDTGAQLTMIHIACIPLMGFEQGSERSKEVSPFWHIQCTVVVASTAGCIIDLGVLHACSVNSHKVQRRGFWSEENCSMNTYLVFPRGCPHCAVICYQWMSMSFSMSVSSPWCPKPLLFKWCPVSRQVRSLGLHGFDCDVITPRPAEVADKPWQNSNPALWVSWDYVDGFSMLKDTPFEKHLWACSSGKWVPDHEVLVTPAQWLAIWRALNELHLSNGNGIVKYSASWPDRIWDLCEKWQLFLWEKLYLPSYHFGKLFESTY